MSKWTCFHTKVCLFSSFIQIKAQKNLALKYIFTNIVKKMVVSCIETFKVRYIPIFKGFVLIIKSGHVIGKGLQQGAILSKSQQNMQRLLNFARKCHDRQLAPPPTTPGSQSEASIHILQSYTFFKRKKSKC